MNPVDIQKELMRQIRIHIAPLSLADELTTLLNTTPSNAYRRINGSTLLSLEEIAKILNRYPFISFDKLIRPNQAPFILPVLNDAPKNVFDYLDVIESDLDIARQFPEALISYAAQDLLLFHYLLVPEIALFKLYMWGRTIWHFEGTRHEPFDLEKQRQNKKLLKQIGQIADAYLSIHSEEIWNVNMLDVTMNQIQHCYLSGHFSDTSHVRYLFSLLKQLSQKLQDLATLSHKTKTSKEFKSPKLSVWYNELVQNNTFILAQLSETQHLVFSVFDSPNFMYSTDSSIYEQSQTFFNKLKQFSRPLSDIGNEHIRHLFFQRLNRKIDFFQYELLELEQV